MNYCTCSLHWQAACCQLAESASYILCNTYLILSTYNTNGCGSQRHKQFDDILNHIVTAGRNSRGRAFSGINNSINNSPWA